MSRGSSPRTSLEFRPALAGLRAVAVLAVLAYHLDLGWLPGGFLGVDIFFVLSGFLITTLLVREFDTTSRISIVTFYLRRFRRLLPAVVVLIVVVAVLSQRYDPITQLGWREDAVATLMYIANWHFITTDSSYFAEFADISPLRHMWSLAIEEQFYVVWPVLAWTSLKAKRWITEVLVCLMLVASATLMAVDFAGDPSRAYYGTDTRVHELLVGVAAALMLRRMAQRSSESLTTTQVRLSRWLVPIGAAGISAGLLTLRGQGSAYYYGGAVAVSLATAALVIGLEFERGHEFKYDVVRRFLSNPVAVWVGAISYSLYLWHWPVQVMLESGDVGLQGAALAGVRAAVSLALATVSYYLVEQPLRRGRADETTIQRIQKLAAVPAILTLTGVVAFASTPAAANTEVWSRGAPPGVMQVLGSTKHNAPTLAVVGDSIAKSLIPALDEVAKREGVRLIAAAWSGCGVAIGYQLQEDASSAFDFSQACNDAVPATYERLVARYHPAVVWMHSVRERFPMRAGDGSVWLPRTPAHDAAILAGWQRAYALLSAGGATVEVAPVTWRELRHKGECRDVAAHIPGCEADDGSDGVYNHLNDLISEFAVSTGGAVKQVGTSPIICTAGPPCPEHLNGHPDVVLRWDGSHFTPAGAALVAPLLFAQIDAAADHRLTRKG